MTRFIFSLPILAVLFIVVSSHALNHDVYDLSNIKVMGSQGFMEGYLNKRNAKHNPSPQPKAITKRTIATLDVNKHKKCGPGIGYCDLGDW
jgi:hypothetical protein